MRILQSGRRYHRFIFKRVLGCQQSKDPFTLTGISKTFRYDEAETGVPQLWEEYYRSGKNDVVRSVFGVSIDENMEGDTFEYLIGDILDPAGKAAGGFITRVIPEYTWAVFACRGAASRTLPDIHENIFSEWLPNCGEYEIAAGYHIEMYGDPAAYSDGAEDEQYYSEIWIPVRKK